MQCYRIRVAKPWRVLSWVRRVVCVGCPCVRLQSSPLYASIILVYLPQHGLQHVIMLLVCVCVLQILFCSTGICLPALEMASPMRFNGFIDCELELLILCVELDSYGVNSGNFCVY